MTIKSLKNVIAFTGFMITMGCVYGLPHMVKWFMALYIIHLIAIWLGNDDSTH